MIIDTDLSTNFIADNHIIIIIIIIIILCMQRLSEINSPIYMCVIIIKHMRRLILLETVQNIIIIICTYRTIYTISIVYQNFNIQQDRIGEMLIQLDSMLMYIHL